MVANYSDFANLNIRVETFLAVKNFDKAKNPAFQLWVDLGEEIGAKYTPE